MSGWTQPAAAFEHHCVPASYVKRSQERSSRDPLSQWVKPWVGSGSNRDGRCLFIFLIILWLNHFALLAWLLKKH